MMLYINKCYHVDGTEMKKDYKLGVKNKVAQELLEFLSHTEIFAQKLELEEENKMRDTA